jgi:hypothetical protein
MTEIYSTDNSPLFFGKMRDNQCFIGWIYYNENGYELGMIDNIWYEPDELYKSTDGYAGNTYKITICGGATAAQVFAFRHIQFTIKRMNAFVLRAPCK